MTGARRYCARCFGRDYGTVGLYTVEDGTPDGEAACSYHATQALEYGKTLRAEESTPSPAGAAGVI